MKRQSISLTEPNNDWLNQLVEAEEFSSKSEVVNDLIRRARHSAEEHQLIRMKLELAEKSGFTELTPNEILKESYARSDA
jgi:antitoxin ParD1/3/4